MSRASLLTSDRPAARDRLPRRGLPERPPVFRTAKTMLMMLESGEGNGDRTGEAAGGETESAGSSASRGDALRVLIVEDEAIIALDIEDGLTDLGVEVIGTAASAGQAVDLAGAALPDVIMMDVRLQGGRDGVSAALEIFERFGIRCVFLSAYSDEETRQRAAAAEPLAWLSKPLSRERLETIFRQLSPHGPR
ncbi:MAG: response regulator [Acetobacterales bacterium]